MFENRGSLKIRSSFFEPLWLCVGFGFVIFFTTPGFPACPGDPHFNPKSIIHFSGGTLRPTYFHQYSTAQIEAMRHSGSFPAGMHNPGLTMAEHEFQTSYKIGGTSRSGQAGICIRVESIQVRFACRRMDVYLSSKYPKGSCVYQVVLAHENQHVAINTRVFKKYSALMKKALLSDRTIPTKANPMAVNSVEEGKAFISTHIDALVKNVYEKFTQEAIAENAKIDTMENYRRTQAKCKEW